MDITDSPAGCDLLLAGGTVMTLDASRRVIRDGAVAMRDGRITAVGTRSELSGLRADATIDCDGKLLMPGLVDGHTHLFQTLGRGLGDGLSLVPWLQQFMFPYAGTIDRDTAVAAARLGALQAALSGTTFVVDNHYSPTDTGTTLAVADAIDEIGIRGAVARGIFGEMNPGAEQMGVDPGLFRWSASEELAITAECMSERPKGTRVEVWPAPENIVYVTPDLIAASADLAVRNGVRWHMHCSESADEIVFFEAIQATRPVAWLETEGLLSEAATLAHAIWLDDEEVAAMGRGRAVAVHNPISNQYLASGVLRLNDLLEAGATVALGTDGIAVAGQDMIEVMKSGTLMHRVATLDPTATTVEQFIELAALHGSTMAGHGAGSLEEGKAADVVVLDLEAVRHTPFNRPAASVVHSGRAGDVDTVVVAGEVIVRDGASTRVDTGEIKAKAAEATRKLFAGANLDALAADWQ